MYETYFGLQQEPFSIAADPRFLYLSDKHRDALAHLNYGLRRGASFVLLTGEIGAGKTTVWRRFLQDLPSTVDVANVVNPRLGVHALLTRICEDLGVPPAAEGRAVDPIDALHGHLLLAQADGRRTLIVVDEAQALSMEVFEQLRLLTNLDSAGRKLQVLLIGQPELRQILARPQLEPLAQRVVTRYHLPALSEAETAAYVRHRLAVAGLTGPMPFDAAALQAVHRLAHGVPRRINVLCDRALLGAQARDSRRIDAGLVETAAAEAFGEPVSPARPAPVEREPEPMPALLPRLLGFALVGGVSLAAGALLLPQFGGPRPDTAPSAPASAPAVASAPEAAAAVAAPAVAAVSADASPSNPAPPALAALFHGDAAAEAPAWRALAGLWGQTLGAGAPCEAAPALSLQCYRARGGLATVRALDRPGILTLVDARGRHAYVVLTALDGDRARLLLDGVETELPLGRLAPWWRGDFATLWRTPPGYREGGPAPAAGDLGPWLARRLAPLDGGADGAADEATLRARVRSFQLARGLVPDGLAGPLTLMQLSHAGADVGEPRLVGAGAGAGALAGAMR